MRNIFVGCGILFLGISSASAQNWASDVAPILYQKCTSCHHTGGIGPFPLMTYDEAFSFRAAVKEAVMMKTMPPWPPAEGYGQFAHPRNLSAQQIQTIAAWVDAGAPSGNLADAPPMPVYNNNNYAIQNPDLVLKIPTYTINTDFDLYRCFAIPTGLPQQRFVQELEVVPGNPAVVHHVLVFQDPSQTPLNLDAQDPGPGYTNFGGTGSAQSKLIAVYAPGALPTRIPDGMGIKLNANTNLVLQIHYPGGTYNQQDSTEVRIKFAPVGTNREVQVSSPLTWGGGSLQNGPFVIPANTTRTFLAKYTVPANGPDLSGLSVGPHMHLLGRWMKVWGVTPQNDTIPLIHIPHWDFHWQSLYAWKNLVKIPKGTTLWAEAFYDNTTGNPHNPSNPPVTATGGEGTNDEMLLVFFSYTPYQNGDENISQEWEIEEPPVNISEGIVQTLQWYDLYPNPAHEQATVSGYVPTDAKLFVRITDMNGKILVQKKEAVLPAGHFSIIVPLDGLAAGTYVMQLFDGKTVRSKPLIKN